MNNDKFTLFHIFNTIQKPIVLYIIKILDQLKVIIEKIKNNIQKIINHLYAKWEEIKPTPLGKKIIKYTQTPYLIAYLFMTIVLFFIIKYLITKIPEKIINNIENAINNFINSIKNAIINFVPGDTYNMKLFVVISIIVLFIMYKTGVLQFLLKYIGQFILFLMYLVNIRSGIKISVIFIAFVIFCFMAKLLLERIKTINDKKREINNITKERTDSLEQLKNLSYQVKKVDGQVNEFKDVIKDQMNDLNINKKMCKKDNTLLNTDYTKLISNVPSKIDDIISSSIKDNTENLRKMKREVELRKRALAASRNNEINKINNEINNARENEKNQERLHIRQIQNINRLKKLVSQIKQYQNIVNNHNYTIRRVVNEIKNHQRIMTIKANRFRGWLRGIKFHFVKRYLAQHITPRVRNLNTLRINHRRYNTTLINFKKQYRIIKRNIK